MVKCADCGFVAVRGVESQQLFGPLHEQRRSGHSPANFNGVAINHVAPICVVGAFDLEQELPQPGPAHAANLMAKERECLKFTKWIPGLSPKEHIDMDLMERQRLYNDHLLQVTRDREDVRDKLASERADRLSSEQKTREDRRDRRQNIALIIAALAICFGPAGVWLLNRYNPPQTASPPANVNSASPTARHVTKP